MRTIVGLIGIAWGAAASPSWAVDGAITYDCDTAAGHFSQLSLPAPAGPFIVEGMVENRAIAPHKTYAATASVMVTNGMLPDGRSSADEAGFRFSMLPGKERRGGLSHVPVFTVESRQRGEEQQSQVLPFASIGSAKVPFRLRYDGQVVAAAIDDEQRSLPFAGSQPVVTLICSTGEFLFTDLRIVPAE